MNKQVDCSRTVYFLGEQVSMCVLSVSSYILNNFSWSCCKVHVSIITSTTCTVPEKIMTKDRIPMNTLFMITYSRWYDMVPGNNSCGNFSFHFC